MPYKDKHALRQRQITFTIHPHLYQVAKQYNKYLKNISSETAFYRGLIYAPFARLLIDEQIDLLSVPGMTTSMVHQLLVEQYAGQTRPVDRPDPLLSKEIKKASPHFLLDEVYFPRYIEYLKTQAKKLYTLPEFQTEEFQEEYRKRLEYWDGLLRENEQTKVYTDTSYCTTKIVTKTVIVKEPSEEWLASYSELQTECQAIQDRNTELTSEITVMQEKIKALTQENNNLTSQNSDLQEKVKNLEKQLMDKETYKKRLITVANKKLAQYEDVIRAEYEERWTIQQEAKETLVNENMILKNENEELRAMIQQYQLIFKKKKQPTSNSKLDEMLAEMEEEVAIANLSNKTKVNTF